MISRRKFITVSAIAAVSGYSIGSPEKIFGRMLSMDGKKLIPSESLSNPVLNFTNNHFKPLVNTNFKIQHKEMEGYKTFRLLDVKDLKHKANELRGLKGDSFSLLFRSNETTPIEGNVYNISHNKLGEFSLHLEPVTAELNLYEAIINRIVR